MTQHSFIIVTYEETGSRQSESKYTERIVQLIASKYERCVSGLCRCLFHCDVLDECVGNVMT